MSQTYDPVMTQVLAHLRDWGVTVQPRSPQHVKVGDVNYYPRKGTIYVDGEARRRTDTGLDALQELLMKKGLIEQRPLPVRLVTNDWRPR